MSHLLAIDLLLGGLGVYLVKSLLTPRKAPAALPPGPKPKPVIGNLLDLPGHGDQEWVHWGKHKELYGPISSVTTFGKTIIIINDAKIAFDLLESRSLNYSDRPKFVFADMVGWTEHVLNMPYGDSLRERRRELRSVMGSKDALSQFSGIQEREIKRFCLRTLREPDRFVHHLRTEAGGIILSIAYGYSLEPHDGDPLVHLADVAVNQLCLATVPGVWLVDSLPFLRNLPDWFPGTGFKETAASWRRTLLQFTYQPYEFVKHQVANGTARPSYVATILERKQGGMTPEEEYITRWTASSLFTGGADTTVSAMSCFILAMLLFPDVQLKAQEELDRVVGYDRLPTFEDREDLPYINAVHKETLRWHPVTPMLFPHAVSDDDIYDGYFIPKDSIVVANAWSFMHDPDVFHDPMVFKPERFLGSNPEPNPSTLAFGFGRRVCPGRELAESSLFLNLCMTLAVFDIKKKVVDGKVVEPRVGFSPSIVSHPDPFECSIKPRSEKAAALVMAVEDEHPFVEGDAKELMSVKY